MTKSCALKGTQKVFLLHLDQAASCCRAYPSPLSAVDSVDELDKIWKFESQQLNQGIELPDCQHCWNDENRGIKSYRQRLLKNSNNFNTIELHIDNACNQMCSYCSPKFSSKWESSINEHGMFLKISASAQKNLMTIPAVPATDNWISKIYDYINRCDSDSVVLKLLGGEPLMQIRNLEQLLQSNLEKIHKLQITTNLNPPNSKFLQQVLDTFPKHKLNFEISLDTVPEHNAIPRAGFDKNKFEENLNLLKIYNIPFTFLSVISVLSIFSLYKYLNWLTHNNYNATFFSLNNPDCLDIKYLPQQFKEKLLIQNLPDLALSALQQQSSMIDIKQFEQYNYLKQYFERTDTQITDSELAEYWSWLGDKFK